MNLQELIAYVFDYARGMLRYRWWALGAAWLVAVPGWLYVYSMPDVYEASAKVFVDTNTLLDPLMKGLMATENTMSQVDVVAKAVLTRPNIERVVHQTDLNLRARTSRDLEDLVTKLQHEIKVSGGRDNIFTIEYHDPSREKAHAVVAAVVDAFIEHALGTEGDDEDATKKALKNEIDVHEKKLRDSEEALAKFKQENLGYMPGQYGDYYERLQAVESKVAETKEKLQIVKDRRDALQQQVAGEVPVIGIMPDDLHTQSTLRCSQGSQISDLQSQLETLKLQYTDKYPRVATLQDTIAALKKQCDTELEAAQAAGPAVAAPAGQPLEANPVYQNLKIQLSDAEVQLAELNAELKAGQRQVAELKRDVDKITEVEAQLKRLNRDYSVVQTRHQELLKRWEDLQAKERIDPVTDKVQYRRIEPPFALPDPVDPNRPVLLAGVLVAGLGAGLALAFVLNLMNPVFFTRAGLGRIVEIPVLGSISMILTPADAARRRHAAVVWSVACLALLVATGAVIVFAGKGGVILRGLIGGVGT